MGEIQTKSIENNCVAGYEFASENDAVLALQEYKKVCYLDEHMDYENPDTLLKVLHKAIDSRAFQTPVGYDFLMKIRENLLKLGIEEEEIPTVPLYVTFTKKLRETSSIVREKVKPSKKKEKLNVFHLSVVANVLLIALVIAMFVITLNSSNPNIINYENAILDKYATWEQEISDREAVVREKEQALNIQE